MLDTPVIHVIIPVYKAEKYIAQTLDSVIGQPYPNIQIICVDDGSPDDSIAILRDYEHRYENIHVIRQENGGVSKVTPSQKTNGNYTKINVELQEKDEKSPLNFYRQLLKVRKTLKSVIYGTVTPFDNDSDATFCYSRDFEDEKVISINNFKDYDVQVKLPAGKYKVVLTNYGDVTEIEDTVTLRPYEGISAV